MLSLNSIVLVTLCGLCLTSYGRTWTDASGRTFEGTLIRKQGNQVFLNISGRQRSFTLSQLSVADQSFLKSGATPSPTSRSTQRQDPATRALPRSGQIQADTSIKIERLRVEPENKRWVYGSPNFEFICDEDLGFQAVKDFAWMFESVWQFCATMPFDIPRLRAQQKVRMKTYLIEEYANYVRLGGLPNSAGVYIPSQDVILIPFQSLDMNKGAGQKDANNTLRHEVTHQLMTGQSQQAGWFIEGAAEYVATVPYDRTRLLTGRHMGSVASYVSEYGWNGRRGHNLGKNITLGRLESFMQPNYAAFQAQENAYPYALMLFTYFAKFDGQKDGARLSQLRCGFTGWQARAGSKKASLGRTQLRAVRKGCRQRVECKRAEIAV